MKSMKAKFDGAKRLFWLLVNKEFKYKLNKNRYVSLIRNWRHINMVHEEIEKVKHTNKVLRKWFRQDQTH